LARVKLDLKRLRWPEWLVGAGGLVLLGSTLLLPWYTLTPSGGPPSSALGSQHLVEVDGWNGLHHARWLVLVTVILALALALFQATRRAPAIPVTLSVFAAILGGLTWIWMVYRVLISPPGGSAEAGAFIGLLSALAIAYGGYASMRMEGIAASDAPAEIPMVRLTRAS
jgi:hypothetical protein